MPPAPTSAAGELVATRRPARPPVASPALLTRQHIAGYLAQLGFVRSSLDRDFVYANIRITLLDTPRLAARFAGGLVYLSVASLAQLEEQLTSELGYQRPPASPPSSPLPS